MPVKEYGYEYDAVLDVPLWEKTNGRTAAGTLWNAICLRSGRDSLKAIAREYKPSVVFMPALSCASMALPFTMHQHEICYYRLTEKYTVDIDNLIGLIGKTKRSVLFLYMDYFGNRAITDVMLKRLKMLYPDMIFIEDRTHNLIHKRSSTFTPDYIMASLRKWANVPDGGLLWANKSLHNNNFGDDLSFFATRLKAQCMRREFFLTGARSLKAEYRRIFSTVSGIIDSDKEPSRMSEYSFNIAKKTDWETVKKKRAENAETLISILQKNSNIRLIQDKKQASDLYVPFYIENRDIVQSKLSQLGIFNTVIWPLSSEQKAACLVAGYTGEHMLAAPCDQRYTKDDMIYIGNEIVRVVDEQENNDSRRRHSAIACHSASKNDGIAGSSRGYEPGCYRLQRSRY